MSRLVNVPPQRVYGDVPLLLPLIKMSEAEAIWLHGQPQIYDKDYPLDYSGLNFSPPWWADTGVGGGLSGVGGGNVRMLDGENEFGFGSLGLTQAQIDAKARRQAKNATKPVRRTTSAQATTAARQSTAARQPTVTTDPRKANCEKRGGTWGGSPLKCTLPQTQAQSNAAAKKACVAGGGVWDARNNVCGQNPKQTACLANGGTWANNTCTQNPAQAACIAANDVWANGACNPSAAHTQCLATTPPGTWANGKCTAAPPGTPPSVCPLNPPSSCSAGMIIGTDANGCTVCVADPNYIPGSPSTPPVSNPQVDCQNNGGYWNGTYCGPPPQQPPYGGGGGGGGLAPIPPGFDSGGGGGMPMSQGPGGPGPQLNDQAFSIPQPDNAAYTNQTPDDSDSEKTDDTGSTDDTSKVADTNILESISKLFSGMNGLGEGLNAAPSWFGMGKGGNVPQHPMFFDTYGSEPVKPSTTVAVVGGAVVLMVGAAALFLWSKGTKK